MQKRKFKKEYDIVIAGAGASGIAAALYAAEFSYPDCKILLLERNKEAAIKIKNSGAGRCNISNSALSAEHYFCPDRESKEFLSRLFFQRQLDAEKIVAFAAELGVPLIHDKEGERLYPYAMEAASFRDLLLKEIKNHRKIQFELDCEVESFGYSVEQKGFRIKVKDLSDDVRDFTINAEKLIVATGGPASPQLGGRPGLMQSFKEAAINYIPQIPALVPLKLKKHPLKHYAAGCRVRGDLVIKIDLPRPLRYTRTGEFLFTKNALSGIASMEAGTIISYYLNVQKLSLDQIKIYLNFLSDYGEKNMRKFLADSAEKHPERSLNELLQCVLPRKILRALAQDLKALKPADMPQVLDLLAAYELPLAGIEDFAKAQTSFGGVALSDIELDSFAAKVLPDLYVCGENLAVSGYCGGFNLHLALVSGLSAGLAAARTLH